MKLQTNIDKCEIFGEAPQKMMDFVSTATVGDVIKRDGYALVVTKTDGVILGKNTTATFAIRMEDNTLATITFKNTRKFYGTWILIVNNRVFYTSMLYPYSRQSSDFDFIPLILDDLGLNILGISKLEVALDVNVNAGKRLTNIRKDTKGYDLILHGRKVSDMQRLKGCGLWYNISRKTLEKHPTLYIENAKGLSLKTYSKRDEIWESGKYYIMDWNGWDGKIWRSEIFTKNRDINSWIKYCENSNDDTLYTSCLMHFLHNLSLPEYRLRFWRWQVQRLMRFSRKKDSKKCDVFDVIVKNI